MHRRLILLLSLLIAVSVWAQETDDVEPGSTDAESTEITEPVSETDDDPVDDDVESDDYYADDDDDAFIPSENVKFGQSIPFPTDI